MAVRLIATAVALFDVVLAIGIALYAVRELRHMIAPALRVRRGRWSTPQDEAGAWQGARARHCSTIYPLTTMGRRFPSRKLRR